MKHFIFSCASVADSSAISLHGNLRVSVLKPGLVRIEFDPTRQFEDRPSQHFWNRKQTVPEHQVTEQDGLLGVETDRLILSMPLEGDFEAVKIGLKSGTKSK